MSNEMINEPVFIVHVQRFRNSGKMSSNVCQRCSTSTLCVLGFNPEDFTQTQKQTKLDFGLWTLPLCDRIFKNGFVCKDKHALLKEN